MNKKIITLTLFAALSATIGVSLINKSNTTKTNAYNASSLPTTIDLNDSSASTIRSYYSGLNNLSSSERQGTNLLKNLKTILKNGQKYFSYENGTSIWQMYEITDRDWEKSPASSTTYGTYNANTNKITNYTYGTSASSSKNNPYIHALYINRNVDNQTTAWDDHNQDEWGINREHVWPKAEGFDSSGAGGARGDPMHLMAGNGHSNNIHSNYYYGYVKTSASYTDCGSKYSNQYGNLRGTSKTLNTGTVFEPQDCDKGDIARAIFYMVARYNYLSGSDSDGIDTNNPNLTLTQDISDWSSSGYTSSTTTQGKLGILTDLLAWHHADPVDEYEIHRNNLLYTNFTNNRNPFIDFPEWVDFIWGTATYSGSTYQSYNSTPTGYANPSSDTINGYNSGSVTLTSITLNTSNVQTQFTVGDTFNYNGLVVTAHYSDSSSEVVTPDSVSTPDMSTAGNKTVTVSYGGQTENYQITISNPAVTSISASVSKTYKVGETISKSDITVKDNNNNVITDFTFSNNNYQFTYGDAVSGGSLTNKIFTNAISANTLTCSLTVQVQREARVTPSAAEDVIDKAFTGISGNSYQTWTDKAGSSSSAVYTGNNYGGATSIQLRSGTSSGSSEHAGIISTTSGGLVTKVTVSWASGNTSTRALTIYGKNTAYTSQNDLYDTNKCGTLLGTLKVNTGTVLDVTGDYAYIGLCSTNGAIYLDTITISYGSADSPTNVANYIMYEDTNGQCNTKFDIAKGYFEGLTVSDRNTFMTSTDYVIATARERLEAWATHLGKVIDHVNGDYQIVSSAKATNGFENNQSTDTIVLVMVVTSLAAVMGLIILKKKHR